MQRFYFYSNNFTWFQYLNYQEYFKRLLAHCWKNFLEEKIVSESKKVTLFNEFYSEIVAFS